MLSELEKVLGEDQPGGSWGPTCAGRMLERAALGKGERILASLPRNADAVLSDDRVF